MADSAINQFVASGTAAEMAGFTPTPPSPASGPDNGYTFYNTDDGILYAWDGALWQPTGGGAGAAALSAGTQSANTGTVIFSNSGGVSFGMSNSSVVTATVRTNYAGTVSAITGGSLTVNTAGISLNLPAYLTTAALSQDSSKYAGTAGAITGGSITVNTSGVSVNLPAYLTTAMASNRGTDFVQATAGFHGTNASGTIASSGISVSIGNYLTTAMASNRGSDFVAATATIAGTNISGTIASNGLSLSAAAGGGGNVNFSAGTTSNTYSAVTFADSNGVSWGLNNGTITATVKTDYQTSGAYLTTAMASNRGSDFVQATAVFHGTNATGTIASNGISVSVAAPGAGASVNFSAGTTSNDLSQVSFADSNGVSWGLNAGTITATVATNYQSAGAYLTTAMLSNAVTISNINVSGGSTSSNLSAFKFIDSNGVSWSLDTGSKIYATVKTDYQTSGAYLTTAALSGDTSKYVQAWEFAGNHTAGTTSSLQGTKLYFSGGNNITLSGNSNTIIVSAAAGGGGSINFSAGTTSGNLDSVVFSNSGAISFGLNGSTITASANTTTYNTAGVNTTIYAVGSANSVGTVTRWAQEDHVHAGIGAIGISTGNTLGTSGSVQGTYWIVGGSNQTISQITSNNGSHTLVVSGKNEGYLAFLEPYPLNTATQTLAPGAGTWYLAPFTAFGSMSGGRLNVLVQNTGTANLFLDIGETAYNSGSTGGIQQSYTLSAAVALFSQGTGSNSTRLESLWSNSYSMGWSKSASVSTNAATNIAVSMAHSVSYIQDIGSDGAYTLSQYAGAGSSTFGNSSGASTGVSTVFSSGRNLVSGSVVQPFGFNTTISAGNYWLGYAWSSTRARASTGNLTTGSDFSFGALLGFSRLAVDSLYRNFGSTATTARSQIIPYGLYTAAANMVPPTNIALSSDLSSLASQWVPYFNFQVRGLTK